MEESGLHFYFRELDEIVAVRSGVTELLRGEKFPSKFSLK